KSRSLVWSLLALSTGFGCQKSGLTPGEGYVQVEGGRAWYRIVGSGTRTPLLVLHGRPGMPSYYLQPLAALGAARPGAFCGQLGAGHLVRSIDPAMQRTE